MPLPSGNTEWPPRSLDPVTNRLAVWSAWYSGDPDQLSEMYGGLIAGDPGMPLGLSGPLDPNRPGWRGRLGSTLARWFWGVQTPSNERRTKLHLPVAGDIAAASADLLFSEPPTITIDAPDPASDLAASPGDIAAATGSEKTATQDRLEELIDDGMHATLLEAAEIGSALGGSYLRICWDRELRDRPWLSGVHADAAIPEWRWGVLSAVTFWRVVAQDGNTIWRHLERHEPGAILHGLYEGSRTDLGKRIPLDSNPATAGLQDVVETGVPKLTAGYVPNMRPARVWRDVPAGANLGRADIAGTEGLMDALDETWSSWMRDIRLAKARLLVPDVYLSSEGKGQGASWESEKEIYSTVAALPNPGAAGGLAILPNQFEIRVAEHQQTAETLLGQILRSAGYSTQTYGLSGDVAMTATEVVARERRSFITRDRKIVYWRPVLQDLIETLLAVDAAQFGTDVVPDRPEIQFGDGVSEDMGTLAQSAQLLRAAEAASTHTLVELVHPDWDETRVLEEVALIADERSQSAPGQDPLGMGADAGPGASDPNAVDPALMGAP